MGEELLRFISADEVEVEELPWGAHAWISRVGLTEAEKLMLVRVTMPPGERARVSSASGNGGDHLRG